ncbi:MAG: hypothetical protein PHU95_00655 [Candidatus Thermoplasmatota archaeon]|nr:hypothetical protein [Candidatus Thermoplasmatota archaeon]MDD5777947.1 hypothetical protein [Candidatus Thermoplasmatota archaeon]
MPLPTPEDKEAMVEEMRRLIGPPDDWTVEVDVRPYLAFAMGYTLNKERKHILIEVYSARYPTSYTSWRHEVAREIKSKLGWGGQEVHPYVILERTSSYEDEEGTHDVWAAVEEVMATSEGDALRNYMREGDVITEAEADVEGEVKKLYTLRFFGMRRPPTFAAYRK